MCVRKAQQYLNTVAVKTCISIYVGITKYKCESPELNKTVWLDDSFAPTAKNVPGIRTLITPSSLPSSSAATILDLQEIHFS